MDNYDDVISKTKFYLKPPCVRKFDIVCMTTISVCNHFRKTLSYRFTHFLFYVVSEIICSTTHRLCTRSLLNYLPFLFLRSLK